MSVERVAPGERGRVVRRHGACIAGRPGNFMLQLREGSVRNAPRSNGPTEFISTGRLRGEGTSARRAWRSTYVRRIALADFLCAALAGYVAHLSLRGNGVAPLWTVLALPLLWITG